MLMEARSIFGDGAYGAQGGSLLREVGIEDTHGPHVLGLGLSWDEALNAARRNMAKETLTGPTADG